MDQIIELFKILIPANPLLEPIAPILLACFVLWGGLNSTIALNRSEWDDLKLWRQWLVKNTFGHLYLLALSAMLDRVTRLIGDGSHFPNAKKYSQVGNWFESYFGCSPWTEHSFRFCFILALFYPTLAWLLSWIMGSDGWFGNLNTGLSTLGRDHRLAIGFGMLVLVFVTFWFRRQKGWTKWNILAIIILIIESILAIRKGQFDIQVSMADVAVKAILGLFCYTGGFLTGLLIFRDRATAHRCIVDFAIVLIIWLLASSVLTELSPYAAVIFGYLGAAFAGSFAGAYALIFACALIFPFVIALKGSYPLTIMAAVGVIGIVFLTGTFYVLLVSIQRQGTLKFGVFFWVTYTFVVLAVGYASVGMIADKNWMFVAALVLILPLVNAWFDWVSLGVTRGLLHAIRSGHHSGYKALLWAVMDLLLALLFLILITAVTIVTIKLANWAAAPTIVFDIESLVAELAKDPHSPNYLWVYFLLLSTLIPTLLHFALAGGAASLWAAEPLRDWILKDMRNSLYKRFTAWAYVTLTPLVGFVLVPAWMLQGLWWFVRNNGQSIGNSLLAFAAWLTQ